PAASPPPSRLLEREHEPVAGAAPLASDTGRVVPVARVRGIAQEVRSADELEPGALDVVAQGPLLDAVEGLDLGRAGAGAAAVIDDDVEPAGAQVLVHGVVHAPAIDAHPVGIVVEEHDDD